MKINTEDENRLTTTPPISYQSLAVDGIEEVIKIRN